MNRMLGRLAAVLVLGYQRFISPLLPPACRFYPSCSEYSRVSFIRHGFMRGIWLSAARILRCNPWNPGGWDPVPSLPDEEEDTAEYYGRMKGKRRSGSD